MVPQKCRTILFTRHTTRRIYFQTAVRAKITCTTDMLRHRKEGSELQPIEISVNPFFSGCPHLSQQKSFAKIYKTLNVESLEVQGYELTAWDLGGRDQLPPPWRHHFSGTNAAIFVIDSNDRDRIELARDDLLRLMNEEMLREEVALYGRLKQERLSQLHEPESN